MNLLKKSFIIMGTVTQVLCQELPFITNYDRSLHNGSSQNFNFLQGINNNIYIANNYSILRYNGETWHKLSHPNGIRSITRNENGRIFWSSYNDFGYLDRNRYGHEVLVSLKELMQNKSNMEEIWDIFSTKNGVYLSDGNKVLRYHNSKIYKLNFNEKISRLISPDSRELYLSTKTKLYKILQNQVKLIKQPFSFSTQSIINISNDTSILVSKRKGLFYKIKNKIKQLNSIHQFKNDISTAIRLNNGMFVFGTYYHGIFICDKNFKLKNRFDNRHGLTNSQINSLSIDRENNLWITSNDGIYKVEFPSPFSFLQSKKIPVILSLSTLQSVLFVGSTQGLYKASFENVFKDEFKLLREIPRKSIISIKTIGNEVFVGTAQGLYLYKEGNISSLIDSSRVYVIRHSPKNKSLYIGSISFLYHLTKNNSKWFIKAKYPFKPNVHLSSIEEDDQSNLWISSEYNGLFYLNLESKHIKVYTEKNGLKSNAGNRIVKSQGKVLFISKHGRHIYKKKEDRFLFKRNESKIFKLEECQNHHILKTGKNRFIYYDHHIGTIKTVSSDADCPDIDPLERLSNIDIYTCHWDGENLWIGNTYGNIISYNYELLNSINKDIINTQIINIMIKSDSTYSFTPDAKIKKRFDIRNGEISFAFSLPSYKNETSNMYQYRLLGYDSIYSDWLESNTTKYTNLSPGNYTFQVRGKNVFSQVMQSKKYSFHVIRPWFINWPGYLLYLLLFSTLIFLIIKTRTKKILQKNYELEKIIVQRTGKIKEQLALLSDKNEELKEMDRLKSDFFSNISHEFRTPLTMILGPLESLLSNENDSSKKNIYQLMKKNTSRILKKIEQLLELSKAKSIKIDYSIVDLAKLIDTTTSMLSSMLEAKKIKLISNLEDGLIAVDIERIKDLIINLITNAVKYSPEGSNIFLSLEKTIIGNKERAFRLTVRDKGVGIAKKDLPKIFDRFFRVERDNDKYSDGIGLGLALVKHIVEQHLGTIKVDSSPGKGSCFEVILPVIYKNYDNADINYDLKFIDKTTNSINNEPNMEQQKKIILIVEDNTDLLNYISGLLNAEFNIIKAKNGKEAWEKIQSKAPDLIISDVMMPKMNGYDFCEELKNTREYSHIPLILLTAKTEKKDQIMGYKLGADAYILKPFMIDELKERIYSLLRNRELIFSKYKKLFHLVPKKTDFKSLDEIFLNNFLKIAENHLSNPSLNIDLIAHEIGLSRAQVYVKIKKLTNKSPKQIIRDFRLKRAEEMLKSNCGNISDIAYGTGFQSVSYFSKVFEKEYGLLPSKYKS